MAFTAPCCKRSGAVSVSSVQFPAAHAPTPSARSTKVCFAIETQSTLQVPYESLRSVGSVGLVSRFGQFYKSVDPGLVQVNVCTESLRIVDVKIQISPIGRQKVITRDNVDVEMCALSPHPHCCAY